MPITKSGLKFLGFEENENIEVSAQFSAISCYRLGNIYGEDLDSEVFEHHAETYIARVCISHSWENGFEKIAPALLLSISITPNNLPEGPFLFLEIKNNFEEKQLPKWIRKIDGVTETYKSFSNSQELLNKHRSDFESRFLTSFCVDKKFDTTLEINCILNVIFATSNLGLLVDRSMDGSFGSHTNHLYSNIDIQEKLAASIASHQNISSVASRLFLISINERDLSQKFMRLFQVAEQLTKEFFQKFLRDEKLARKGQPSLRLQFELCLNSLWKLDPINISIFKDLKEKRDSFSHGSNVSITSTDVEAMEKLAREIIEYAMERNDSVVNCK